MARSTGLTISFRCLMISMSISISRIVLSFGNTTGPASSVYSQVFVPQDGMWYHFAMVFDGREVRFYVNGELFQGGSGCGDG